MSDQATDYKALVGDARRRDCIPGLEWRLIDRLADAVEALLAERAALRAQLDSMTTEWSSPDTGSVETRPFPFGYGTDEQLARHTAEVMRGPVYTRLVGPWVEVTD